ncbi:MAG: tetratricopeptide repeat protein, partial [bacterium]
TAGIVEKDPNDVQARLIRVCLAKREKRFGDAIALLREMLKSTQYMYHAVNQLIEIAELQNHPDGVLEIIEQEANLQNYYSSDRLAPLYFAAGNKEKGCEYLIKEAENRGRGPWDLFRVMENMTRFGLWEEMEQFYEKNKLTLFSDEGMRGEILRSIASMYIAGRGFTSEVEGAFQKETLKRQDIEMIKALAECYRSRNDPRKEQELLLMLAQRDALTPDMISQLARSLETAAEPGEAIPVLERLIQKEPNKREIRECYAKCLIEAGRQKEALDNLTAWADEKPMEERFTLFADMQKRLGRFRAAREMLQKAFEVADETKKADLQRMIADFEAVHGDPDLARKLYREYFETRRDEQAFSNYTRFLLQKGFDENLLSFLQETKDSGFLNQYSNPDLINFLIDRGDLHTPIDMAWRSRESDGRRGRSSQFDQLFDRYRQRGKSRPFIGILEETIESETPVAVPKQQLLAKIYHDAGDGEKALAIYSTLLEECPFDRDLAKKKGELLLDLKRDEEALFVFRSLRKPATLREEIEDSILLARTLFQLNRPEEAESVLSELLAWAGGAECSKSVASLYFSFEKYEEAIPHYEMAKYSWQSDPSILVDLGKCYAMTGQHEKAIPVWEETSALRDGANRIDHLHSWIQEKELYLLQVLWLEKKLAQSTGRLDIYVSLARAYQKLGKDDKVTRIYRSAYESIPRNNRTELVDNYAEFLTNSQNFKSYAEVHIASEDPFLIRSLSAAFQKLANRQDKTEAKELLDTMARCETNNPEAILSLAMAYATLENQELAALWYQKLLEHPEAEDAQRRRAAYWLAKIGVEEGILPSLQTLFDREPEAFIEEKGVLEQFVKLSGDEQIPDILKQIEETCLYPSQKRYYKAWITYTRGNKEEALPLFKDLLTENALTWRQLREIANILRKESKPDVAKKFLERLAAGGYEATERRRAILDIVKIDMNSGATADAIEHYTRLLPDLGDAETTEAGDVIAASATVGDLNVIRERVESIVQENPTYDRVSDLIGYFGELAEGFGKSQELEILPANLKLEGVEKEESGEWQSLIEEWRIAGPYPCDSEKAMDDVLPPESDSPSGPVVWNNVDTKIMRGVIRFDKAFDLEKAHTAGKTGYALTTIQSPDERDVVFSLGSDDWAKVWVNGGVVYSPRKRRPAFLDRDSFSAKLKQGENTVLVKVGNQREDWRFCLRISEGNDGLSIVSPH